MKTGLMAGASRFAHLAFGIGGARADADDDNQDKDGKKGKAAAEDDDGDPDDDGKDKDGKKGKAAAEDDDGDPDDGEDDEEEMHGKSAAARARRRERARCAAIFACSAAGRNPELAASLAFETTMTRQQAIKVLKSQSGAASSRSRDRSDRNPNLDHRGSRGGGNVQQSWATAFASVTPAAKGARQDMRGAMEAAARGR